VREEYTLDQFEHFFKKEAGDVDMWGSFKFEVVSNGTQILSGKNEAEKGDIIDFRPNSMSIRFVNEGGYCGAGSIEIINIESVIVEVTTDKEGVAYDKHIYFIIKLKNGIY
jgi:hypothetical protein